MNNSFLIVSGALIALVIYVIFKFNQLARHRNQIDNSLSALDALFIQRSDLIPNLIEVVKEYKAFEAETLEQITTLRTLRSGDDTMQEDGALTNALKQLMIQVENYPDLKASEQFLSLQHSWNEVEDHIAAGRRYVSSSITNFNNSATTFPGNIIAKMAGYDLYEWQKAKPEQRENIHANDLFSKK